MTLDVFHSQDGVKWDIKGKICNPVRYLIGQTAAT
jgi:hypothetical protein